MATVQLRKGSIIQVETVLKMAGELEGILLDLEADSFHSDPTASYWKIENGALVPGTRWRTGCKSVQTIVDNCRRFNFVVVRPPILISDLEKKLQCCDARESGKLSTEEAAAWSTALRLRVQQSAARRQRDQMIMTQIDDPDFA